MSPRPDPRVVAYLEETPEFARPLVERLRELVHDVCPRVQEALKWGQLGFVYRGKILCILGVFKAHCRLHFWHPEVSQMIHRDSGGQNENASGTFGRLTSLADLPGDEALRRYLEEAVERVDSGEPIPQQAAKSERRAELPVPEDFAALLDKTPVAKKALESFPPSHRREYLEWIVNAKRPETRARRMATAVEWLSEGKPCSWKYQKKAV